MVTQKPPVLTVSKGDTATMGCNLGTVTNQSCSLVQAGSRWSSSVCTTALYKVNTLQIHMEPVSHRTAFTSTRQSETESQFIITNVEAGDTAVYYCNTWDSSVSEIVSQ